MVVMKYRKTEWGRKVKDFTQQYGIPLVDIAGACGINYMTLLTVMVGKTPGTKACIVEKVNAFMEDYAAKSDLLKPCVEEYKTITP